MDAYDADRETVLEQCRKDGVERMIIVGTDPQMNRQALAFCDGRPGLFPTVGWHPHDAKDWTPDAWKPESEKAGDPRVVAVGEVGLDYFKNFSPPDQQKRVFSEAIRLARELKKPLVVHSREAHADVLELLKTEGRGEVTGVMHCFSAETPVARQALDIGFYISFSAVITYPKNNALRETARSVPADRLLVETDSPFLPPQDRRGQRNEPCAVRRVVETLAQTRGVSPEDLAGTVWDNASRLFRLG